MMKKTIFKIYTICNRENTLKKIKPQIIILLIIIATIVTLPVSAQLNNSNRQGIIAIVNKDIISQFDFIDRIKLVIFTSRLPNNQKTIKRISGQILRGLINEKLKIQQAKKLGIKISRDELRIAINEIEKMNGLTEGQMRILMRKKGINFRSFALQVEAETRWRKAVVKQVLSKNRISEDSVDDAIAKIKLNKGKPEYKVAEIFISFEPNKSMQKINQNAIRLHSQIQKGAKFSELARAFSQKTSAAKGGNLGWIRGNQIDQELLQIIVTMKKNTISKPIKGEDGFYILRLLDKRISSGLPTKKINVTLEQLFLPLPLGASTQVIADIKSRAKDITSDTKNCDDLNRKIVKFGSKQSGRIKVSDISQLPINIRTIVQKINIAEPSIPIRTSTGVLVLMVCTRSGGGLLPNFRNSIRNRLLQERAVIMDRRMLRNIRRSAFVDIRQ